MTVQKIARRYRCGVNVVYSVIYTLSYKHGYEFSKRGRKYELTDREVELIRKELERRGYKPREV